jgi:hypothetical protein
MKRLSFHLLLLCALAITLSTPVIAQFGGQSRARSERPVQRAPEEQPGKHAAAPFDPVMAIERELPSLRIDLKLTSAQAALFDSFQRNVRDAADAARTRLKHVAAVHASDGKNITALALVNSVAEDDMLRADAMKEANARIKALYDQLTSEQKTLLDRRFALALRDPLGNS